MFDTNENDVYWKINESKFVIQGVPDFNTGRIIPLGMVIANEGELSLKIDELENFPSGKACLFARCRNRTIPRPQKQYIQNCSRGRKL